jgi:hypothetical protein
MIRLIRTDMEFLVLRVNARHVHIRKKGLSRYNPGIDQGAYTLCGRPIPQGAAIQTEREVVSERLCGRCYATLRTYSRSLSFVDEREGAI